MNQMGYPTHPYGSYHSLAQAGGMGGALMTSHMAMMGQRQSGMVGVQQSSMMGQQNGLMGAHGVMAQPSSAVTSPYMTGVNQGMMGQQQSRMMGQQQNGMMGQQQNGMMGQQQVGSLATLPHQQVYGVQQAQQLQWNIAQVCVCVCLLVYVLNISIFVFLSITKQHMFCCSQMTQQMAGVNLYNSSGMMGYSNQQMGGSTTESSAHMTAHIWK